MEREEQKSFLNSPLIQITREKDDLISNENDIKGQNKIVEEVKKQLWLAGPLIAVSLLQYCIQMISVMFVGHLGELALSGASMATSFASVTGFSLLLGMSTALDTLCGQSYGAKQYPMLGIHMQRAMFILLIVSIPLTIIWVNTRSILVLLGQDHDIAKAAGDYARLMVPSLSAYGLLQCLVKFLQTQNTVFPMMICSGIATLLHILVCWIMVFKTSLGFTGAALANAISYWINVFLLVLYVKFSPSCAKTWAGFSKEAFQNIVTFLRLAIPSAIMVCLEMWSFEMMVLLSGLLPNPQLQTSVLSVCLNTAGTVWMIPFGLSGAVSTRVSNELGAGHPEAASLAVCVVIVIAICVGLLVGSILMLIRNVWGYAFSNEVEVIKYVAAMMPILALSNFLDGLQCVLSGTARGCGWQKIGAYVNLGSYYLVGIPCAVLFAFVLNAGGRGLWLGIICALVVQVTSLSIITIRTNWQQEREHEQSLISSVLEDGSGFNGENSRARREEIIEEVKKQLWLAGPLICESFLLYFLQVISVMFVGHLGALALSSASLATSLAAVLAFNLLIGMSTALETLCGQSYGAKQYHMLGIHTQRAMFVLSLISIPLAIILASAESILAAIGQDPEISRAAGVYARFMIPSLFAYAILQCLLRFLRTQNNVFPMVFSSGITTLIHIFLCWILVLKFGLGSKGAALAGSISYWINVLMLAFYIKLSPSCTETWTGFSKEALHEIFAFLRLAFPSAVMVCLESWSFQILVFLSGLLPNPELETSVITICINSTAIIWMIPFGLSSAASIRLSNELGAKDPKAAKLAVRVVLVLAISQGILVGLALILMREIWGYAYSNDEQVVKYVAAMSLVLAISNFIDGIQCVLSGIARGCGWQKIGAYINLGSYYIVGTPLSVVLAFVFRLGVKGLWLGIIGTLITQMLCLLMITIRTNWEQEAKKATVRVHEGANMDNALPGC
ncbi:Multi antimicrobial extrusion protein [Corchorus olitorius]|uniref:Protein DETOXIFICATION n=1 Tax=Corchorus olitorius TaxID=93759 RepID=A0A1R3G0C2_9ROSI|nr:Multi antimicrobial extrusion protein [Corchorus olitorius]